LAIVGPYVFGRTNSLTLAVTDRQVAVFGTAAGGIQDAVEAAQDLHTWQGGVTLGLAVTDRQVAVFGTAAGGIQDAVEAAQDLQTWQGGVTLGLAVTDRQVAVLGAAGAWIEQLSYAGQRVAAQQRRIALVVRDADVLARRVTAVMVIVEADRLLVMIRRAVVIGHADFLAHLRLAHLLDLGVGIGRDCTHLVADFVQYEPVLALRVGIHRGL
jgi:hypothetical protein